VNAIPSHESDRAELAGLLPAPAYPDLPADRQLLMKDDLMSHLQDRSPLLTRKRVAIGLAAPLALAATVAVVVSGTSNGSPARPSVASSGRATTPSRIVNAAYTLDVQRGDTIRVTIHRAGAVRVDDAQLKKDLARLGVNAHVTRTLPRCKAKASTLMMTTATTDGHGNFVHTFVRSSLKVVSQTIFFPKTTRVIKQYGRTVIVNSTKGDYLTVYLGSRTPPTCLIHIPAK
jgi:hypothetical protein